MLYAGAGLATRPPMTESGTRTAAGQLIKVTVRSARIKPWRRLVPTAAAKQKRRTTARAHVNHGSHWLVLLVVGDSLRSDFCG